MNKSVLILGAGFLGVLLCLPPSVRGDSAMQLDAAGRVTLQAADTPLADLLPALCAAARCDWISGACPTSRVTVSASGLEPEQALLRVLEPFDYLIVWRKDKPSQLRLFAGPPGAEPDPALLPADPPSNALRAVETIAADYAAAGDPDRRAELEAELASAADPAAESALLELASAPPGSPLRSEALAALANMGSATSADFLLARVEEGGADAPAASALVAHLALSPRTAAALRSAALGNKRVSSVPARLAAMRGLVHWQDGATRLALEQLARDPEEAIRLEAERLSAQGEGL